MPTFSELKTPNRHVREEASYALQKIRPGNYDRLTRARS
jgi:hypothetical protein